VSWALGSFVVLGLALALGFAWYERSRPPARVLALVAALAALAVVGRLAFAPFPNVKPTTDIVLFAGYALGGAPGFAVGSVTALVSNVFLSHGPWTPWQMAAWGGVGLAGGWLGALARRRPDAWEQPGQGSVGSASGERRELGRWPLALACGLAGFGYGVVMDLYLWTLAGEHSLSAYALISARSLPFNVAHVVGNVLFALLIGPPLVRALRRYRRRFEVRWAVPTTARSVAGALIVAAGVVVLMPSAAWADSTASPAVEYLRGSQNGDGSFAYSCGAAPSETVTGEVALGLAAAGHNPRDVRAGGSSIIDYMGRQAAAIGDVGDLEWMILGLHAAGVSPRRFAKRDFYGELLRARGDGSFDGPVNHIRLRRARPAPPG